MSDALDKKTTSFDERRVAVLIPCLNEEVTIGTVVADFKKKHFPMPKSMFATMDQLIGQWMSQEKRALTSYLNLAVVREMLFVVFSQM